MLEVELRLGKFNENINIQTHDVHDAFRLYPQHNVIILRKRKNLHSKVAFRLRVGRVGYAQWHNELSVYMLPRFGHPNILPYVGCDKRYHGLARSDYFTYANTLHHLSDEDSYHSRTEESEPSSSSSDDEDAVRRPPREKRSRKPRFKKIKMPIEYIVVNKFSGCMTLRQYLQGNTLTWSQMILIARGIADGLVYLHEHQLFCEDVDEIESAKGLVDAAEKDFRLIWFVTGRGTIRITPPNLLAIVHRNLTSLHIVLQPGLNPCIWDFGQAHVYHNFQPINYHDHLDRPNNAIHMNSVYSAPEVLIKSSPCTYRAIKAVDMYSVGIVFWEMISRCELPPIESGSEADNRERAKPDPYRKPFVEFGLDRPPCQLIYKNVVELGYRPPIKDSWMHGKKSARFLKTIRELWDHDFDARIQAVTLSERMHAMSFRNTSDRPCKFVLKLPKIDPITASTVPPHELLSAGPIIGLATGPRGRVAQPRATRPRRHFYNNIDWFNPRSKNKERRSVVNLGASKSRHSEVNVGASTSRLDPPRPRRSSRLQLVQQFKQAPQPAQSDQPALAPGQGYLVRHMPQPADPDGFSQIEVWPPKGAPKPRTQLSELNESYERSRPFVYTPGRQSRQVQRRLEQYAAPVPTEEPSKPQRRRPPRSRRTNTSTQKTSRKREVPGPTLGVDSDQGPSQGPSLSSSQSFSQGSPALTDMLRRPALLTQDPNQFTRGQALYLSEYQSQSPIQYQAQQQMPGQDTDLLMFQQPMSGQTRFAYQYRTLVPSQQQMFDPVSQYQTLGLGPGSIPQQMQGPSQSLNQQQFSEQIQLADQYRTQQPSQGSIQQQIFDPGQYQGQQPMSGSNQSLMQQPASNPSQSPRKSLSRRGRGKQLPMSSSSESLIQRSTTASQIQRNRRQQQVPGPSQLALIPQPSSSPRRSSERGRSQQRMFVPIPHPSPQPMSSSGQPPEQYQILQSDQQQMSEQSLGECHQEVLDARQFLGRYQIQYPSQDQSSLQTSGSIKFPSQQPTPGSSQDQSRYLPLQSHQPQWDLSHLPSQQSISGSSSQQPLLDPSQSPKQYQILHTRQDSSHQHMSEHSRQQISNSGELLTQQPSPGLSQSPKQYQILQPRRGLGQQQISDPSELPSQQPTSSSGESQRQYHILQTRQDSSQQQVSGPSQGDQQIFEPRVYRSDYQTLEQSQSLSHQQIFAPGQYQSDCQTIDPSECQSHQMILDPSEILVQQPTSSTSQSPRQYELLQPRHDPIQQQSSNQSQLSSQDLTPDPSQKQMPPK